LKIIKPRFKSSEYCRTVWYATPEPGTDLKDLLEPGYWTHVASELKKGDRIEAVDAEGTWFAEFYVKSANKVEAYVALMRECELSKHVAKLTNEKEPDYIVKHYGGGRYRVMRTADKAVLVDDIKGKDVADKWLEDHLKEIAA
jgi:hypothetical protein